MATHEDKENNGTPIFADNDDNVCTDEVCIEDVHEEEIEYQSDNYMYSTNEHDEEKQVPTPKKQKKIDNLGRVRPSSYAKRDARKPKSTKKQPPELESSETVSLPATDSHSSIQFNTDSEKHEDCPSNPQSPIRKEFYEIVTELMENSVVTEICEGDDFSFENLIPDNEIHVIEDNNEDPLMGQDEENQASDSGETFPKDTPIYPGHFMSVHHSMVLILLYAICHTISGAQLADTLTLVSLHCLHSHPGLKSIYTFKKYFADMHSPLMKHYFCKQCMTSVKENDTSCPSKDCGIQLGVKNKDYFIELPLEEQLKKIMKRPGILNLIKSRFNRKKRQFNGIEDIYDGAVYKRFSEFGGPLSSENPTNVSFTWNTDGIPVFKSSKFSLWPLYLVINELPFKQRFLKENMILCGLWFGESKPFMSIFTKPLMKSLKILEGNGIYYEVDNEKICTKGFLICGTADLPAKSIVLNCNQFNGQFSCMSCLHPGETYRTQKGGSVHTFPYDASMPKHEERTTENCLRDAVLATENRKTVNGIKGPSFLMTLKSYDFVKSTSIDYMHGVLLGIGKLLINLWISSTHSKEIFSISNYVEVIDQRLLQIRPPSIITRVPRSLSDHFKYWKASELRSWLFFYSLPILHDILPGKYLLHFACFVEGIFLLCTDSVTSTDIEKSSKLLSYFVHMFPSLYGERYITLNMHSLLHLPQCVTELGPLWVYSCFPFENINGTLMELFHGTQNVELQIMCGLNVLQNMTSMIEEFDDQRLIEFANKLTHKRHCIKSVVGTSSGSFPIGMSKTAILTDDIYSKIIKECKFKPVKLLTYKRISLRGRIIHSMEYTRVYMRNTFTVSYFDMVDKRIHYGQIESYVLAKACDCIEDLCLCNSELFAIVHELKCKEQSIIEDNFLQADVSHIRLAMKTDIIQVVDVSKILNVVVYLSMTDKLNKEKMFLCNFPNVVESD